MADNITIEVISKDKDNVIECFIKYGWTLISENQVNTYDFNNNKEKYDLKFHRIRNISSFDERDLKRKIKEYNTIASIEEPKKPSALPQKPIKPLLKNNIYFVLFIISSLLTMLSLSIVIPNISHIKKIKSMDIPQIVVDDIVSDFIAFIVIFVFFLLITVFFFIISRLTVNKNKKLIKRYNIRLQEYEELQKNQSISLDAYEYELAKYEHIKNRIFDIKLEIDEEFKKLYNMDSYSIDEFMNYMSYCDKSF